MARLVAGIDQVCGTDPVVVAGDLNTATMPTKPEDQATALETPDLTEPLFAIARQHGFDWLDANTADPTQRQRPDGMPTPPFRKIDWVLLRGLAGADPRVVPAVDDRAQAISDHELLVLTVTLPS